MKTKTGLYAFKSPYHKNKQLPFMVLTETLVKTVEYKGFTAYKVFSNYQDVNGTIDYCKMKYICSENEAIISSDKKIKSLMTTLSRAK